MSEFSEGMVEADRLAQAADNLIAILAYQADNDVIVRAAIGLLQRSVAAYRAALHVGGV